MPKELLFSSIILRDWIIIFVTTRFYCWTFLQTVHYANAILGDLVFSLGSYSFWHPICMNGIYNLKFWWNNSCYSNRTDWYHILYRINSHLFHIFPLLWHLVLHILEGSSHAWICKNAKNVKHFELFPYF